MIYGYLRLYKDENELIRQKNSINKYAEQSGKTIDGFLEVETYSKKIAHKKRIDFLLSRVSKGDTLVVAELSRMGRNILEVLKLIERLRQEGIAIVFVNQPELSTTSDNPLLETMHNIFGYFAEAEQTFISVRTKQGLAAVKAKGIKLGRPKGHKNKKRALDDHREEIMQLLNIGVNLTAIRKIINRKLPKNLSYSSYKYFIDHDEELLHARHNFDKGSLLH